MATAPSSPPPPSSPPRAAAAALALEQREWPERARLEELFRELGLRKHCCLEEEDGKLIVPWWRTALSGILLLVLGLGFFGATLYAVLLAKALPTSPSQSPLLDFIREDKYYCLLLPWTLPPTVVLLYLNWLGLEFYRAN